MSHHPKKEFDGSGVRPYPESPERLQGILEKLYFEQVEIEEPRNYSWKEALRVHDEEYIQFLLSIPEFFTNHPDIGEISPIAFNKAGEIRDDSSFFAKLGNFLFDPATPIMKDTLSAVLAALNCSLSAVDTILNKQTSASFALGRPPGHHAWASQGGGYCFLNNAAIAAQYAVDKGNTVSILDLDFHHGNGTQQIFYDTDQVQYVSIHGDPHSNYPFYWGFADENGTGNGQGFTHNYPVPQETNVIQYMETLDAAVGDVKEYAPDIVILSLGFDTLLSDPVAGMRLKTSDYLQIAEKLQPLGKIVGILEGGYDVSALGEGFFNFYRGLTDE